MILALLLLLNMGMSAGAERLVDFESGKSFESSDLLRAGRILIYAEKDCAACLRYIRQITDCPGQIVQSVDVVSISTPAQTKRMVRDFPHMRFYLGGKKPVTPVTYVGAKSFVGLISCEKLVVLQGASRPT